MGTFSFLTIVGALMAIIGASYWVVRLVSFRRTQRDLNRNQTGDPDSESNTFAAFWAANGMLHLGMLLLVLGGAGLIWYGGR